MSGKSFRPGAPTASAMTSAIASMRFREEIQLVFSLTLVAPEPVTNALAAQWKSLAQQ